MNIAFEFRNDQYFTYHFWIPELCSDTLATECLVSPSKVNAISCPADRFLEQLRFQTPGIYLEYFIIKYACRGS